MHYKSRSKKVSEQMMISVELTFFTAESERAQLAEHLIKSNSEIQRLLAQNNTLNEDKIREMRELMRKYHSEKTQLETSYAAKVSGLEVFQIQV